MLTRWLLSYFILLMATLIISLFAYAKAIDLVRNETMRVISASTEQLSSNMDLILQNTGELARQIGKNEYLYAVLYNNGSTPANDTYQMYKLVNELDAYIKIYDNVDDILVYRYDDGMIVNGTARYSSDRYYDFYGYNYFHDYAQWIKEMKSYQYLDAHPGSARNNTQFYVLHSVVKGAREESKGMLAILLDYDKIAQMLSEIQLTDQGEVFFYDEGGHLVFGTGDMEPAVMDLIQRTSPLDGVKYIEIAEEEYAINAVSSQKTGWKSVAILRADTFSQPMVTARNWIIWTLTLALAVGVVFSFFASKRNYAPVRSLLTLLNRNGTYVGSKNEYHHIEQGIQDMMRERSALDRSNDMQRRALRENLIERMITGHIESTEQLLERSENYRLSIPYTRFHVILISITNYDPRVFEAKGRVRKQQPKEDDTMDIIRFAMKNIGEELFGSIGLAYMVDIPGFVGCLLNDDTENETSMETELLNCMYQYQALLLEHFHADVTISISSSESIEKIHCLYAQALEAMEYAEETNDSVIFYSRIPKRVLQGSNLVNAEYQMLNCIVTFDYKNAVPAIAALFSACGADRDDLAKEKGRLHSLCYLFAGIADTLVQRYDLGEEGAQDFKAALLQAKTLDSMEKACIQLMARVDQHTHQRREGVQEEIIHQALQYIQDHYSSPNLSVTSIADHFKIALPRLSRQFKEFQGEGMLDYINRLRILRAKQLINEEKMTVKDASESVGFTSTQTFIRVFKKYEGTTPGKLKKK